MYDTPKSAIGQQCHPECIVSERLKQICRLTHQHPLYVLSRVQSLSLKVLPEGHSMGCDRRPLSSARQYGWIESATSFIWRAHTLNGANFTGGCNIDCLNCFAQFKQVEPQIDIAETLKGLIYFLIIFWSNFLGVGLRPSQHFRNFVGPDIKMAADVVWLASWQYPTAFPKTMVLPWNLLFLSSDVHDLLHVAFAASLAFFAKN